MITTQQHYLNDTFFAGKPLLSYPNVQRIHEACLLPHLYSVTNTLPHTNRATYVEFHVRDLVAYLYDPGYAKHTELMEQLWQAHSRMGKGRTPRLKQLERLLTNRFCHLINALAGRNNLLMVYSDILPLPEFDYKEENYNIGVVIACSDLTLRENARACGIPLKRLKFGGVSGIDQFRINEPTPQPGSYIHWYGDNGYVCRSFYHYANPTSIFTNDRLPSGQEYNHAVYLNAKKRKLKALVG